MKRVLIFIPSYNVEYFINKVVDSIPFKKLKKYQLQILIINDNSSDNTFDKAKKLKTKYKFIKIINNKKNQGYGGVQKIAYSYAIIKKFDFVIMLHGDNQYKSEYIPKILSAFSSKKICGVQGSRMIHIKDAYNGNMPIYKIFGNLFLTFFQNCILNLKYSEYHSGYRAYSVNSLKKILFIKNTNYFNFDTEILIQFKSINETIIEIPIKTFYGKEYSNLRSIPYGFKVIFSTLEFYFNSKKYKKYQIQYIKKQIHKFYNKKKNFFQFYK